MKNYKCTNVQGKVNPIIKEALDNYKHIKCRCRGNSCWYEDTIRGIVLNKNLDGSPSEDPLQGKHIIDYFQGWIQV